MDDRQMFSFKKVAELEHMTRAAEELHVSQAQLSRIIASLEKELGCQLFDRQGRNIRLNDAGRIFYQHALKIIGDYGEAITQVREAHARNMFKFAVGTNVGAYMPRILASLPMSIFDSGVRQFSAPRRNLTSMLRNGSIDFALVCPRITGKDICSKVVNVEYPAIIYPDGHWLADKKKTPLKSIADETLVGGPIGYGARDIMERYYHAYDVHPRFAVETANTESVEQYVYYGLGIAVVPKSLTLKSTHFKNQFAEFEENLPCEIALCWHGNRTFNETEQLFVDTVAKYFEKRTGADEAAMEEELAKADVGASFWTTE